MKGKMSKKKHCSAQVAQMEAEGGAWVVVEGAGPWKPVLEEEVVQLGFGLVLASEMEVQM